MVSKVTAVVFVFLSCSFDPKVLWSYFLSTNKFTCCWLTVL